MPLGLLPRVLSDRRRENLHFLARPIFRRRKMEEFAAPRLSILSAWRPGRRCPPRRRLFPNRSHRHRRVSIFRLVPPRSVLLRHHPIRRRRKFSQPRQDWLLFLASAPMPILFIAGLLQRRSEIFGGVFAKFLLQR